MLYQTNGAAEPEVNRSLTGVVSQILWCFPRA